MGGEFDTKAMQGYWLLVHVEEPQDVGTKEKARYLLTIPIVKDVIRRDSVTEVHHATPEE